MVILLSVTLLNTLSIIVTEMFEILVAWVMHGRILLERKNINEVKCSCM